MPNQFKIILIYCPEFQSFPAPNFLSPRGEDGGEGANLLYGISKFCSINGATTIQYCSCRACPEGTPLELGYVIVIPEILNRESIDSCWSLPLQAVSRGRNDRGICHCEGAAATVAISPYFLLFFFRRLFVKYSSCSSRRASCLSKFLISYLFNLNLYFSSMHPFFSRSRIIL